MKQTKLDMAKVIIQALYNLEELPEKTCCHEHIWKRVIKTSRMKKDNLVGHFKLAHIILTDRIKNQ